MKLFGGLVSVENTHTIRYGTERGPGHTATHPKVVDLVPADPNTAFILIDPDAKRMNAFGVVSVDLYDRNGRWTHVDPILSVPYSDETLAIADIRHPEHEVLFVANEAVKVRVGPFEIFL